ncbi:MULTISPECIES: carbon-nitrogen hydrolase [Metallibacterium]|jgi:N-carbamoylputrescine amidase|uniref:carbon-nitrogen hydrolase n=1 Tax=Metallibacterium TaxID=1218803 RepID=UPI002625429B|nr:MULTISPECIES: carbon-nitrogen hydrolase [Metallibacterium]MBW8074222.1 acyltransferase [Metallibacterium scheffleri]
MPRTTLSLALLQQHDHGSRQDNLDAIAADLRTVAADGAQLVLLQELHNGAYFCQCEDCAEFERAESIPGPSTEFLAKLAAELNLVIVASLFERRASGLYHNTAVVLDKTSGIVGKYRKMHIPDDPGFYEKFYFTPGDLGFEPIETSLGRLGVLVCWDQWYPEAARLMALRGADILLYPTAIGWDPTDSEAERQRQREAWLTVQRGHAIANGLPLAACNRVGLEPAPQGGAGIQFWGSSFACGPQGEMLAHAGSEQPARLLVQVDLQRSEQVRRIWPFLRDRRIDAYGEILRRYRD